MEPKRTDDLIRSSPNSLEPVGSRSMKKYMALLVDESCLERSGMIPL